MTFIRLRSFRVFFFFRRSDIVLWETNIAIEIAIYDLTNQNGGSHHSHVNLPEGITYQIYQIYHADHQLNYHRLLKSCPKSFAQVVECLASELSQVDQCPQGECQVCREGMDALDALKVSRSWTIMLQRKLDQFFPELTKVRPSLCTMSQIRHCGPVTKHDGSRGNHPEHHPRSGLLKFQIS